MEVCLCLDVSSPEVLDCGEIWYWKLLRELANFGSCQFNTFCDAEITIYHFLYVLKEGHKDTHRQNGDLP
jgi:hypothetical protein